MRRNRTKIVLATVAAVVAATAAVLATGIAQAEPDPYDDPIYAEAKAPTSIPSDMVTGTEGVPYKPFVRNTIEDDAGAVTLTVELASADTGVDPQLIVTSQDDRCTVAAATVTCELDALPSGYTETFALRLHVADASSWKANPVTDFTAVMSGGAADTSRDSTYVYDVRYDDVERVDFVLPEIIPNDMQPGTEGVPMRFQINNDIGQELPDATFTVDLRGIGDRPPSTIIGADDDQCQATATTLTCHVGQWAAGQTRTFEARFWAAEEYQDNLASEVAASITWKTEDGTTHTFAKRGGYSWVAYDQ